MRRMRKGAPEWAFGYSRCGRMLSTSRLSRRWARVMRAGGLALIPTETVYGIGVAGIRLHG